MTKAELEAACASLRRVGGVYAYVAAWVWEQNEKRCDE